MFHLKDGRGRFMKIVLSSSSVLLSTDVRVNKLTLLLI